MKTIKEYKKQVWQSLKNAFTDTYKDDARNRLLKNIAERDGRQEYPPLPKNDNSPGQPS